MKITYKLLVETATTNLTKIFDNPTLCNGLNKESFYSLVLKQISILDLAEKKDKQKSTSKKWLDKLNEINNSSLKLMDVKKLTLNEMFDDLNYISIYIKNVFKLDLYTNQSTEDVQKIESKPMNSANNDNNTNPYNSAPYFGFDSQNFMNNNNLQEQFIQNLVVRRLMDEVNSGVFYRFKSKPKYIVILKYIIGAISFIFGLITLAKIIISIPIGSTLNYMMSDGKTGKLNLVNWSLTFDILMVLGSWLLSYSMFKITKNENLKYFFSWPSAMLIIVALMINSLLVGLVNNLPFFQKSDLWTAPELNNAPTTINLFYAYLYLTFVLAGIVLLLFVVSFMTIWLNPKVDIERIKLKQEEIYKELKSSMSNDKLY